MAADPNGAPRPNRRAAATPRGPTEAAGLDLSPLDGHLGFLMRIAQQRMFEEFHRRFGADGLTPARYSVLALLAANPDARQVAVANALQIKQSNFAVLIGALEEEGLLERRMDEQNRRANMLRLTPAGETLHAAVAREVRAMEAEFAQRLPPRQREALLEALRRFLPP